MLQEDKENGETRRMGEKEDKEDKDSKAGTYLRTPRV